MRKESKYRKRTEVHTHCTLKMTSRILSIWATKSSRTQSLIWTLCCASTKARQLSAFSTIRRISWTRSWRKSLTSSKNLINLRSSKETSLLFGASYTICSSQSACNEWTQSTIAKFSVSCWISKNRSSGAPFQMKSTRDETCSWK